MKKTKQLAKIAGTYHSALDAESKPNDSFSDTALQRCNTRSKSLTTIDHQPKTNSGFTLVELAIVIVIIGLLVGGVLQGQSLIEAARVHRAISDFKKYEAAIWTFKSKYNVLPGDMRNAYTMFDGSGGSSVCGTNNTTMASIDYGCNGNGDGLIGEVNNLAEVNKLWVHLNLSNILKEVPYYAGTNYRNVISAYGVNVGGNSDSTPAPNNPVFDQKGGVLYTLQSPRHTPNYNYYGQQGLWIVLGKRTWSAYPYPANIATFAPSFVRMIDSKIDDGLPTMGSVVADSGYVSGSSYNCASSGLVFLNTIAPSNTITYNESQAAIGCYVMFKTGLE